MTHPENAVLDMVPEDPPVVGHVVSDFAPAYSPDGTTIAFVRQVQGHGPDDTLWDKRGQNLWRVAQNGGDPVQITTLLQETGRRVSSGVWIPGTQDLVVSYFTPAVAPALGRVSSIGGNPTFLAGKPNEAITDFDVSPGRDEPGLQRARRRRRDPVHPAAQRPGRGCRGVRRQWLRRGPALRRERRRAAAFGLHRAHPVRVRPAEPAHARSQGRHRRGEPDRLALAFDEPVPGNGGIPARMRSTSSPRSCR